ncbi:MAG: NTP transferase domain-containing protein, partial [candidate division Zixibacteria bacterium]|nr:NTP transferase domain-containing protein [candidate division Zixibacteria bacterium]
MATGRSAIVLAAGKGKRMKSDLPKVLHQINRRAMICLVMDTLESLGFDRIIVVIGYQGELVQRKLADRNVSFVWQREQLGTGHAVLQLAPLLKDFRGDLLILYGDTPLFRPASIRGLLNRHRLRQAHLTLLTAVVDRPLPYGRIIRDAAGRIMDIIEETEASPEVREIRELNV